MPLTYGKRKRVSAIFKKYSGTKKARTIPYIPKTFFEHKTHLIGAGVGPTTAGTVISMVDIVAGTGRDQRTGNRVTFENCEMRIQAKVNTASDQDQLVRFLIVQDTQTVNSTIPTTNQILQSTVLSGEQLNDKNRFKTLFDKTFALSEVSHTSEFLYYKLPMKITTEWVANTGPQHSKNAIFCLFISDKAASPPSIDYNFRMNFIDW